MPVKIIDGDLFETKANFICHQVNCQGRMRSGVAKQVREKFPVVYRHYKAWCDEDAKSRKAIGLTKSQLLGRVQVVYKEDYLVGDQNIDTQVICNMFSQDQYGYNGKQYTDYEAFEKCLLQLKERVPAGETIAMPYKIGCGLGGGDWSVVLGLIERVLSNDHTVELWKKEV